MLTRNDMAEVRPVKRYSVPKYPSYLDLDPARFPEAYYPYPFRKGLLLMAASLGFAATLHAASDNEVEGQLKNPLTAASSGLPYHSSPFGTGQPSRISEDVARKLINRLFEQEGFSLKSDFNYNKDGVEFTASGYDPEKKIGYVYGTWSTLDHSDAIISWDRRKKDRPIDVKYLHAYLGNEYKDKINQAAKIEDAEKRQEVFWKLLEKRYREEGRTRLSLEEAKVLEQRAAENKEYIALISQFDRRFSYGLWGELSREERERISKIKDPTKREKAYKIAEEKVAKQALNNLENSVRSYIDWVRSQGF